MKQITYNPTNAISILLAAVAYQRNAQLEIKTTDKNGTDFLSKLSEEGIRSDGIAYRLLTDEIESERGQDLAYGIMALHHNITEFDSLMALNSIYNGNKDAITKISRDGRAVRLFIESPAFIQSLKNTQESSDDVEE